MSTVVSIRKKCLVENGYKDFLDWSKEDDHVYIGRNMTFYVEGTHKSKWANPFILKKYSIEECLELYEQHIRNSEYLLSSLHELQGKTLGCWCKPEKCHGDIIIKILSDYK